MFIRLLGSLGSKEPSKVFSLTSCSKQGHLWGQTRLWGILPSQSMKNLKQGDLQSSSRLFHSLTVLLVKISYLVSILDFSSLNVVSQLITPVPGYSLVSLTACWPSCRYRHLLLRSSQSYLFSWLNQPSSLSLYSQDKWSDSLSILVTAVSTFWVYFLYCGGPKWGALDHVWNNKHWVEVAVSSLIYWHGSF